MSTTSGWGRLTWNQANWNESTTLKQVGVHKLGMMVDGANLKIKQYPTGLSITSSIGSVDVPDVVLSLTGQEITSSQGEAFVPVVIDDTLSITSSVGSVSVVDMQVGLTGLSSTLLLDL